MNDKSLHQLHYYLTRFTSTTQAVRAQRAIAIKIPVVIRNSHDMQHFS